MYQLPSTAQKLIRSLSRLPSVGERTATRLAYFLITQDKEVGASIADSIQSALSEIRLCAKCFFFAEKELCSICSDSSRDATTLCIVEKPVDLLSIERMGEYKGLYHVLHGLWAPLKGMSAESLKLAELAGRLETEPVKEVIIATGSTVEGDATAIYIAQQLKEKGVTSSRLAQGMPKGADLEYADDLTLSRAFTGRCAI